MFFELSKDKSLLYVLSKVELDDETRELVTAKASAGEIKKSLIKNINPSNMFQYRKYISIAKKEEELFTPNKKSSIVLNSNSEALFILQNIRDEAHRFAITFQRQKRTKGIAKSKFEDIPGVGKKTVEKIYKRFQNISDMKDLSDKALSYKLGVSRKIAIEIKKII